MHYGIDEELPKKYIHLDARPDGLIYNTEGYLGGILEVKCLKALKGRAVTEWVKSDVPSSACVSSNDLGILVLKKSHAYYYQIQLQLIITEAQYCDFLLYSKVINPHVKRILQ